MWLINPNVVTFTTANPIGTSAGGTGLSATPGVGQLLVGNGTAYSLATTLPASAFPALSGDITTSAGSLATTLATVNGTPGSYGNGTTVATFTVNGKGLVTTSGSAAITGSPAAFTAGTSLTATTGFGCNGKTAQTSAAVSAAIAGTAGAAYTATEQGLINSLVTLVNQLRAALVANGVAV